MRSRQSIALLFVLLTSSAVSAQDTLAVVLQRAGAYATRVRGQLPGIVAEETYVQNLRRAMGVEVTLDAKGATPVEHRTLTSDILMVRTDDGYVEFRDVFDVDGRSVRDRQDRLSQLFLAPHPAFDQLLRISNESARYNIGSVFRNFNTPALALVFLEPEQQARSRFRLVNDLQPALSRNWPEKVVEPFAAPSSAWVVEFQETRKGTLIRRLSGNGDLPSSGRFWIDPATGKVLLTELLVGDPLSRCTISVRYAQTLAGTDVLLPAEMRERYLNGIDHITTTGYAFYSRHRRFGVKTDEVIPAPAADEFKHPFTGRWTADVGASKFNGTVAVQAAALEFRLSAESVVIRSSVTTADGREAGTGTSMFLTNGMPYTHDELLPGLTVAATWKGTRRLETVLTRPDNGIEQVVYEVSADDKTLTVTTNGPLGAQSIIFRRAQ